jgi:two-component system, response regulator / RNA-binding antiterminator
MEPMGSTEGEEGMEVLRDEIERLLAAALQSDADHDAATATAQQSHDAEMADSQHAHDAHIANMDATIATRDLIGQAKGIIMASLGCSPDHAFELLVKQSQAENRKLVDIAAGITAQVQRFPKPK